MPIRILQPEFNVRLEKFLRIDDGSEQMAINGSSAWAEDVWDGTGAGDSGSDWTRGGSGSESAAAAHSGTNGLDTGVLAQNDFLYLDYGSDRDLEASFDSISFWINVQAYPVGSVLRCGWATSGSTTIVGDSKKVEDYLPNHDLGVWQRVSIPLSDFNLGGTPVGRFVLQARQTAGQQFYLDDFDLLDSSSDGPYKFRVTGEAGIRKHVARITLVVAADSAGWNSSAFANISGGLELGLILRQGVISTQEIIWSIAMKNNMEVFGGMVPSDQTVFDDGEQMITFNITPEIASIVLDDDSALEFIVRDDLSTITNMRAYLQYGVEQGAV